MNKAELLTALKEKSIDADPKATNNELEVLLEKAQSAPPTQPAQDEERITPESVGKGEAGPPPVTPPVEDLPVEPTDGDYLNQYQYKKVSDNLVLTGGPQTNPEPGSKAEIMKKILLKQPRVRILIPRSEGESEKIPASVTLNRYRLDFPKNTYIDMPQQVADIIMEGQKQTVAALKPYRIDGDKEKEHALSR